MRDTTADAAQVPARPDDAAVYRYLAFGEADRPFLVGGPRPAPLAPAATPSPVADLESVRAAIRAHGGPLASTAHVCGRPAPTPSAADASRGLRGAARTLTATRRDVAARLADSRERADVPVEALLNSAFVDAHADERPAERGVPRGRLAGRVDAGLPPARPAGDAAAAKDALKTASTKLDKAVSKGVIHANQAANKKSALAKKVASL